MRAAIVIILLILSSAALAQRARTGAESGTRIERPSRDGVGTRDRVDVPPLDTPSWDRPGDSLSPNSSTPSLQTPSAGGGGPPGGHGGHAAHAHGHPSHCHDDWVCQGDRYYVATDNWQVGSSTSGLRVGGYWVPGPC